jgi:hypothetical protein
MPVIFLENILLPKLNNVPTLLIKNLNNVIVWHYIYCSHFIAYLQFYQNLIFTEIILYTYIN